MAHHTDKKFDFANNPTWRVFRIMAEFVDGFEFLAKYPETVTILGSARTHAQSPYYQAAKELAEKLGQAGYGVITGGGPGIMEAANRGAHEADAPSVGLNIELPLAQRANGYLTNGIGFHYFFTRKVMLVFSADAYVFFPGGFGTLDELTELVTLIQTGKIEEYIPIVLFGRDYWDGFLKWIKETVYTEHKAIDARDMEIWKLTDSVDEAYQWITKSKSRRRFPGGDIG